MEMNYFKFKYLKAFFKSTIFLFFIKPIQGIDEQKEVLILE